jgi:hypothetical protein
VDVVGVTTALLLTQNIKFNIKFTDKNQRFLLRDQPCTGAEMKPLTWTRGYDKVLLGQGCRGAVVDGYEMMSRRGKQRNCD